MSRNGLAAAAVSLGAVLYALAAWWAADALTDALGLEAIRPLVVVCVLFLALTLLQAGWDKVLHAIRSSTHHPEA